MFVVLFSPEESRTADQIVQELLPWLHMIHTQSPGAHVFLACSRAESPPIDQPDPSAWRQHVERLAKDVEQKVPNNLNVFVPAVHMLGLQVGQGTGLCLTQTKIE